MKKAKTNGILFGIIMLVAFTFSASKANGQIRNDNFYVEFTKDYDVILDQAGNPVLGDTIDRLIIQIWDTFRINAPSIFPIKYSLRKYRLKGGDDVNLDVDSLVYMGGYKGIIERPQYVSTFLTFATRDSNDIRINPNDSYYVFTYFTTNDDSLTIHTRSAKKIK